jgi:hypothetical protein
MKNKKQGRRATTNLKKRFFLWSTLILISGGLLLSALSFWNTRRLLLVEAMTKSEVILQEVEAIRSYVKEELRPKMYALHGKDTFIIEAMSTTYVSTAIMERFARSMPDYVYRRASLNPHNPRNLADPFEEEMFDWFEEDPDHTFWQGVVKKKGKSFFISMQADYFALACIRCHGRAEDAPQSLLNRYGSQGGFRFKSGDLAGIDSVAVPVSASLRAAWQGSLIIFVITLLTTLIWLWLLNILFQRLVIERLSTMVSLISERSREPETPLLPERESGRQGSDSTSGDELDQLHASLGSLQRYVHSARQGSALQANFIGDYVAGQPVAAGAMSWLYNGYSAKNGNKVALKIGFSEVLQNPLYRACFENELCLFETLSHPCLVGVVERRGDVLVLEKVSGSSLMGCVETGRLQARHLIPIFLQLCDLISSLHAAGVVHHDLRPQVIMLNMENEQQLHLIDMGLAAGDQLPDPITAAGLGPQGDLMYMAPELIRGRRGDPRSDIYSIGVLLYLVATGRLPFSEKRQSLQGWLQKKEAVKFSDAGLGKDGTVLEKIISRAMAADVKKRYQWVEDLQEDLRGM